jgi:hypothetical protein
MPANLEITADNSQFIAKMKESQEAMRAAFESMKGTLEGLSGAFEAVQKAAFAVTAVLAGGAAFREAVDASVNAAVGAQQLGRELGITATQASILKVAMEENHVPMEAVSAAANKIATAIKKNPAEFDRMGVAIRDSNGNMRNSFDIMTDVNTKLAEMKEGTARNVEGQRIYGKSWAEIAPTLRLTAAAMEEAKETAQSLHLIVGKEGIAQTEAYRKAMAGVHTVFDALEKSIGDALLPALTTMAQWFVSIGPAVVNGFKAAIYGLYAALSYTGEVGQVMIDALGGALTWLGAQFMRLATTAFRVMHFDFTGAKAAWAEGTANIEAKSQHMVDKIKQDMADASKARADFFDQQDAPQTPTAEKQGKNTIEEDNAGKSRVGDWQTGLEERKAAFEQQAAAEGQLREFSKQQEIDYWRAILDTTRTTLEERKSIRAKIAGDELAIDKAALEGSLATLKNDESAHGANLAARLAAEMKYADAVKGVYGAGSKEYAEAQKAITATHEAELKQRQEIDLIEIQNARTLASQEIDTAEEAAKREFSLHQINLSQLIALEREFAAQRYALHQQQLAQDLALLEQNPNYDPVKLAQIQSQIINESNQYHQQLLKIDQQSAQQQISLQKQVSDLMSQSFAQAFSGILKGTESVTKGMQKMFTSIIEGVIDMFAKWVAQQITATVTQLALGKQTQASNSATAATGAGASASAIPYIGWAIAIGAMAAVFAAATGYKAEGGFDVPRGLNPMTQLHAQEMVLPAKYAEPLRQNLESGGGAGGRGGNVNLSVSTMDARSFEKFAKRGGAVEKVLKDLHRRMVGR